MQDNNNNNVVPTSAKNGSDFKEKKGRSRNRGFGERLRSRRDLFGLSQAGLAEMIHSNKSTIQNYEKGGFPRGDYLVAIAEILKCPTGWLLMGEGPEPGPPEKEVSGKDKSTEYIDKSSGFDKDGDMVDGTVAAPDSEYDLHGGWEPQTKGKDWELLGKAHKIITSDTVYRSALISNINAFYHAMQTERQLKSQGDEIRSLKKECEDLKRRLHELEKMFKGCADPGMEASGNV